MNRARDLKSLAILATWSLTLVALACGRPSPGRGAGELEISPDSQTTFKVETVVGNLEVVWSIVWTPDGRMIFTERKGRVRVFENGKLREAPLFTVPDVEPGGESGLMSVGTISSFSLTPITAATANGCASRAIARRRAASLIAR